MVGQRCIREYADENGNPVTDDGFVSACITSNKKNNMYALSPYNSQDNNDSCKSPSPFYHKNT